MEITIVILQSLIQWLNDTKYEKHLVLCQAYRRHLINNYYKKEQKHDLGICIGSLYVLCTHKWEKNRSERGILGLGM